MDIRNCKRCNGIFQYRGSKYCPTCMQEFDDLFIKVRDYIYDNPKANIMEVSGETGVEEDIILQFLKDGRLELESATLDFVCERCDVPITTGRYCNLCIEELGRELKKGLNEAAGKPQQSKSSRRMYTVDYRRKKPDR
ncbi:MAG TPA: MerR family transcriptional regulator [Clostridia bacterium]|nr:MerR family transcriptional regulator [Clostridia bacterium]